MSLSEYMHLRTVLTPEELKARVAAAKAAYLAGQDATPTAVLQ